MPNVQHGLGKMLAQFIMFTTQHMQSILILMALVEREGRTQNQLHFFIVKIATLFQLFVEKTFRFSDICSRLTLNMLE